MNYCYIRVSTSDKAAKQTYERQEYLIENSGIKFDDVYEEHISGGVKGNEREQFNKMLSKLQPADTVYFTETSRFGRNYIDCFEMLDMITQDIGASVVFLSQGIKLDGGKKMNPYQWMMISQFFIQDEFLKRQIGYNTSNSLRAKQANGMVLGRPTVASDKEIQKNIIKDYANGMTQQAIADKYGISRPTVKKIVKGE